MARLALSAADRRRRFSTKLKLAVIAETMQPAMSMGHVAPRNAAWMAVERRLGLSIEHGLLDRRVQRLRGEDLVLLVAHRALECRRFEPLAQQPQ